MAYSKSYSKTTRFSSMGGKTRTIENTYMIEKKNKSARFIKGIRVGNKSRSIAGYTPDGKKIAILSQKKNGNKVITLSGFNPQNELRTLGCVNFWCNSSDYGMVEISHQFILHNLADRFLNATIVK